MDTTISAHLDNIETIRYADENVETYETQITRRMSELMDAQKIKTGDERQRLVGCDEVNNTVDILSCKECSCSETEKAGDKVMEDFRKFVQRK